MTSPAIASSSGTTEQFAQPESKRCPLCAEVILAAAIRCKHCGADLGRQVIAQHVAPAVTIAAFPPAAPRTHPLSFRSTMGLVMFGLLILFASLITLVIWGLLETMPQKLPLAIWRSAICLGMVAMLIGAIKRTRWGRSWIIGTSFMQAFSAIAGSIQIWHADNPRLAAVLLVGGSFGIATLILLRGTASEFSPETVEPLSPENGGLLEVQPVNISRTELILSFGLIAVSLIVDFISN